MAKGSDAESLKDEEDLKGEGVNGGHVGLDPVRNDHKQGDSALKNVEKELVGKKHAAK